MSQKQTIESPVPGRGDEEASVPAHVAIICDGNGRWAKQRGFPRLEGHRRGVDAIRKTIRRASEIGIRYLSIYAFSSENWRRPMQEVADLMALLKIFIRRDLAELHKQNVRVKVIGERAGLTDDIRAELDYCEEKTQNNTGMTLVIAFNYGGRQEIVAAVKLLAAEAAKGALNIEEIGQGDIERHLYTSGIPDPEIVIRTSGEQRISNFLTWQTIYSEFIFLPIFWPDFDGDALEASLTEFRSRQRRFGGL